MVKHIFVFNLIFAHYVCSSIFEKSFNLYIPVALRYLHTANISIPPITRTATRTPGISQTIADDIFFKAQL